MVVVFSHVSVFVGLLVSIDTNSVKAKIVSSGITDVADRDVLVRAIGEVTLRQGVRARRVTDENLIAVAYITIKTVAGLGRQGFN